LRLEVMRDLQARMEVWKFRHREAATCAKTQSATCVPCSRPAWSPKRKCGGVKRCLMRRQDVNEHIVRRLGGRPFRRARGRQDLLAPDTVWTCRQSLRRRRIPRLGRSPCPRKLTGTGRGGAAFDTVSTAMAFQSRRASARAMCNPPKAANAKMKTVPKPSRHLFERTRYTGSSLSGRAV
jgi:hypothetical protein